MFSFEARGSAESPPNPLIHAKQTTAAVPSTSHLLGRFTSQQRQQCAALSLVDSEKPIGRSVRAIEAIPVGTDPLRQKSHARTDTIRQAMVPRRRTRSCELITHDSLAMEGRFSFGGCVLSDLFNKTRTRSASRDPG